MAPEKRNPGAGGPARGASGVVQYALNTREDSTTNFENLQAARLHRDFGLSLVLARAIARHAFASGGAI